MEKSMEMSFFISCPLNLNSPLLAGGMNIECDLFLIIGLTQLSRRDTPQLAAGRVHQEASACPVNRGTRATRI
jgi:hypothetical protein